FTYGNLRKVDIYSVFDNLTLNTGKHSMLFGLQADFTKTLNGFQPLGMSYYRFNSWNDFATNQKPADFAMTYSLSPGFAQAFPTFKFAQYSAYFQDEITVNSKFKLTLGLRADRFTYPDVAEVKTNPLVAALTYENGQKVNTGNLPEPRIMWSPRVGFNYDIYGNRSVQLRGGTGIFTGRVPYVWIVGQSGNSGMIQVTQSFNGGQANTPGPFSPERDTYFPAVVPPAGTVIPTTVTAFAEDFKMPQTWKTSAALDLRLPWNMVATIEGIFNKDLNTIYSRNINLVAPQHLNVAGYPDNRLIYPNANTDKYINKLTSGGQAGGTNAHSMILTGNESRGYYASLNLKVEKQLRGGFSAVVSYTKSFADNLFDGGGDQPINTWNGNTSIDGPNNPMLGYSQFVVPDRVIAAVSYRKEYFKHLATQISLFYEGSSGGRYSYTYSNDFNRDGATADLIYIPKDARNTQEIQFVNTAAINGIVYTPAQQAQMFEDFINQDKYLRAHRGQYAERSGGQLPWRNQVDVKILQDLFINVGKNRNTIQFSVDIFNFGNLLNKSWGRQKITAVNYLSSSTNVPILQPQNVASLTPGGATVPTFRLATDRLGQLASTSFYDNIGLSSTYFMQFGLRYIFNN
ncbi:MAG TPA: TonB-dependent receptor, partial [Ferruginibacter sp.]|nr:TonB-dependent receptor [Ferruginibacter sp.]